MDNVLVNYFRLKIMPDKNKRDRKIEALSIKSLSIIHYFFLLFISSRIAMARI